MHDFQNKLIKIINTFKNEILNEIAIIRFCTNTFNTTIKRLYGSGSVRNYHLKCYGFTSYLQNERKGNQLMNPQIVEWLIQPTS